MFDPYWVKALPYRVIIEPGDEATVHVLARNFLERSSKYEIALHCAEGLSAEPKVIQAAIPAGTTSSFPIKIKATSEATKGLHLVAFDITHDGIKAHGELFDSPSPRRTADATAEGDKLEKGKPAY